MKLKKKFLLFNTLPKLVLIAALLLVLPHLIGYFVYKHTDQQLNQTRDQLVEYIQQQGIARFINPEGLQRQVEYDDGLVYFYSVVPAERSRREALPDGRNQSASAITDYRVLSQKVNVNGRSFQIEVGQSLNAIAQLEGAIIRYAMIGLLLLTFIILVIDLQFATRTIQPLQAINQKLNNIQRPEQYDYRRINTSTREFQYLDESLNTMMAQLKEAFRKEKEFVGNASHEMLTPLAILNNRFENIIAADDTPIDISRKIVESQDILYRLNKIIRSLLLISKVEYNYYVKEDTVNLKALLEEVVTYLEMPIENNQVTTEIHVDPKITLGPVNRSLLFTLFQNLVSNGIKYNHPGGKLSILSEQREDKLLIHVKDTGVGIAPADLQHIFEGFQQLKDEESRSNRIGLHLVRSIANMHNYHITVQSTPNQGSTFTLAIPLD